MPGLHLTGLQIIKIILVLCLQLVDDSHHLFEFHQTIDSQLILGLHLEAGSQNIIEYRMKNALIIRLDFKKQVVYIFASQAFAIGTIDDL